MGVIGRWGGHTFEVSSGVIRSFTDMSIKGSSETEEKESNGEKYVSRKNGKPSEVSLNVQLHALLGCNVRAEAMAFVEDATSGKTDYFYVGNGKLFVPRVMLTEASVSKVVMSANGTWTSAEVKLTLKQSEKRAADVPQQSSGGGGGGGGSSSSGSKKASVKTTVPITTLANEVSQVLGVSKSIREANKANSSSSSKSRSSASAVAAAKQTTSAAKTVSAAVKNVASKVKSVMSAVVKKARSSKKK